MRRLKASVRLLLLLPKLLLLHCRRWLLRPPLAAACATMATRSCSCSRHLCLIPMLVAAAISVTVLAAALTSASPAAAPAGSGPGQRVLRQRQSEQLQQHKPPRVQNLLSLAAATAPASPASNSTAVISPGPADPEQASARAREFLLRVAEANQNAGDLLAALKAKLPLVNRLSEDPGLLDKAKSCSATGSLALKYVQHFSYLHNERNLCSGQLLLIAAVHSNAKNFNRRATIRRTWGSLRYVGASRLQLVFFLGTQDSRRVQREIDEESRRFRDLVQLDFQEHYRNMSLKHLSIYEWVLTHCAGAQYLLKVDDDTFTDIVHLVSFLQHSPPDGFYCSNTKGAKPQRLKRGPKAKWAVNRAEFSGSRYPAYCEGFGYAVRTAHLIDLYVCSLFHKFFWIDDVYVTGVLSAAAKVPLTEFWSGHSYTGQLPSLASEKILDYIFLVADHNEFMEAVWHRLWRSVLQYSLDLTL